MSTEFANAIIYNKVDVVERLLNKGVDVNETDDYGYTPLIEAAIANHTHLAELLLKKGAKVDGTDVLNSTALHWSVENHNLTLTKLLLEKRANPNSYTSYGQPILVKPLLRRQPELKELLYRHGADLKFAQDYINTKLLGHRFELRGRGDIIDPTGRFVEIDFEGFVIEFSLSVIGESLAQFKNNFAARNLRDYFNYLYDIIDAFSNAAELIKYQQYLVKVEKHEQRIDRLIEDNQLLLIPMGCAGHATTFIKYGKLWARCDRGENSLREPSVIIYRVQYPHKLTTDFIKQLLYKKQSKEFLYQHINEYLGLEPIATIPLASQITGNCSWANIEAAIPTMFAMLFMTEQKTHDINQFNTLILEVFNQWREWDKDRALHEAIENFYAANPARKAAIAATIAAVLFQTCHFNTNNDLLRTNKILAIFAAFPEYQYILKSYLKIYTQEFKTEAGHNLVQLLDLAGNLNIRL